MSEEYIEEMSERINEELDFETIINKEDYIEELKKFISKKGENNKKMGLYVAFPKMFESKSTQTKIQETEIDIDKLKIGTIDITYKKKYGKRKNKLKIIKNIIIYEYKGKKQHRYQDITGKFIKMEV